MKKKTCPVGWTRRSRRIEFGPAILALILVLTATRGGDALGWESEDLSLENGLRVILVKESKAPVVVTQVWYRVGAADEVDGKTGLAHMLEHMMFQGTRDIPPGEYSRIIARHGGEDNASTAWDYTNYWSRLSSDQLDLALRLEADRMRHLVLDPRRFESENQVVREERRTRTDSNPQGRYYEKFRHFFFQNHPYGRPVIGWMNEIEHHTLKDLEAWYRGHYSPDNAILVIVGDVDFAQAKAQVRTHFGSIEPAGRTVTRDLAAWPPITGGRRMVHKDPHVMAPLVQISWPAASLTHGNSRDVHALDLLAAILGGSGSSRLYRRVVVEQQKAISIQTQYNGSSLGVETFDIYADPPDGQAVAALEQSLLAEVDALMTTLLTDEELQRAKNGLLAERIYARDAIDHLASMIGRLSVNGVDWRQEVEGYPRKIQEVTAERIREVASRYLTRDKAVIGILTP
ncbi:MAG: insulinase family protein [Magnetococcales bacterium]|nr:insulinase family protein [Magnetococcales bacterium]MBF0149329.1 insulinase family protein [Magnetococcales bacterium]MBF0174565.1 insulinase family protein [Magnetococcales bacterium]MBF0629607.1 insulinase family protein [Magnetococcales bacterium]